MSDQQPTPRRARHLIDPDAPRPASTGARGMSLSTVQKWVMSTLAVTTAMHLVVGIVIAAAFVDTTRTGAQGGLLVIAGVMGVLGGVLPALVGAWFVL